MKRYIPELLFSVILILVSIFYNYHEIAFKRPQSTHKWRQSDCASIALNYYQNGMHFLNPETHNLTSDGGTSGKGSTSEIPILYFSVASLYTIFGYHEYIYRIFNTFLFFIGLLFLFRLFNYLLNDTFWSLVLSLLFFTSPVLVYYGNNYLSNSSSIAFSIIGWYYFIRFYFENRPKWFYVSMVVILIAAAFKVTALFSLFAILGIYCLEISGISKFNGNDKLFKQPVKYFISIISIFLIIGAWITYAHKYNQKHDCTYFSTTTFPVWNLNKTEMTAVLNNIEMIWLPQYFHLSVILLNVICFFYVISSFKSNIKILAFSILFILAEEIVYVILQFWTFADHDYYVIDMYILPILITAGAFDLLKRKLSWLFHSNITKIVFSGFLLFNIYYAHQKITERYESPMNDYDENKDLYTITPYLRKINVLPDDTIISIPDRSNASLYILNQKGWTEYTDARLQRGSPIRYNQDSAGIQKSIDKGAAYMVINGIKELYNKPYLQSYCTHLAGTYNNVMIFNLKNKIKNFNLEQITIDKLFKCDAELRSADNQFFYNETDSTFFHNGSTRSEDFAHGGKYSSRLNANSPYGMAVKLNDLKNGESLQIFVWRKIKDNASGGLIASNSPSPYYNNQYQIIETDSTGWERIKMDVFIKPEMENKELVIYPYNPGKDTMYFDDLEIIKYKSVIK